jgi:hypothetical protein
MSIGNVPPPRFSGSPSVPPTKTSTHALQFGNKHDRDCFFLAADGYIPVSAYKAGRSVARSYKEKIQLPGFKYAVEKNNNETDNFLGRKFEPNLRGDRELHKHMRRLIADGDVDIIKKALGSPRVQRLDLNENPRYPFWKGDHIPEGKKSAVAKALTHVEDKDKRREILLSLIGHPKFDPNVRDSSGYSSLLELAALDNEKALVEKMLAHEKMDGLTVEEARSAVEEGIKRTPSAESQKTLNTLNEWFKQHNFSRLLPKKPDAEWFKQHNFSRLLPKEPDALVEDAANEGKGKGKEKEPNPFAGPSGHVRFPD